MSRSSIPVWSTLTFLDKRLLILLGAVLLGSLVLLFKLAQYPFVIADQEQSFVNESTLKHVRIGSQAIIPSNASTDSENEIAIDAFCDGGANFIDLLSTKFAGIVNYTLPPKDDELLQVELDGLNEKLKQVEQLKGAYAFSLKKWNELTLGTTVNRCGEVRKTIAELRKGRRVFAIAWGKSEPVPERLLAEPNPWGELNGCIYLGQPFAKNASEPYYRVSGDERICSFPMSADKAPWKKDDKLKIATNLESLLPILTPLTHFTSSKSIPFQAADIRNENVAMLDEHERRVGYHVVLSPDPELQEKAQKILDCFVGKLKGNSQCPSYTPFEQNNNVIYQDDARVKMAGLVVLDIKTGEILAAASGESAKWRDTAPSGRQNNHALETAINPGSTAKVILSAALINNNYSRLNDLHLFIKTSKSEEFQKLAIAHPIWFKNQAEEMGWNKGCEGDGKLCSLFGELYGRPIGTQTNAGKLAMDTYAPLGRILVEPTDSQGTGFQEVPDSRLHPLRPKSKELNIVEQAAIGHGNTWATPVGVAHYFAYIGAAAEGEKDLTFPHLVKGLYDIKGQRINELVNIKPDTIPIKMKPDNARTLLRFLESTGKSGGTAGHAYGKVFGAPCKNACVAAGKTGTVDPAGKKSAFTHKWYAGLYKSKGSQNFDRAIAVLVERGKTNLPANREAGYFSSMNKAAEIAFEFIKDAR